MLLDDWRCGGRRPWTMPEIVLLRELAGEGRGAPAIWRSGKLPGRSMGAIRAQMHKRGLWGRSRRRFDGERVVIVIPVSPMLRARLRQRAGDRGLTLAEIVRRYCEAGLRT